MGSFHPTYTVQDDPFFTELTRRVNEYLSQEGRSRYAGPRMWLKTAILLSLWLGFTFLVFFGRFDGALFIAIFAGWMFVQFLMTIGIAHDAAHDCYFQSRAANRRVMYFFDFIGINSAHWIRNHVVSHHRMPNVPGHDSAIESFELVRLHPRARQNALHRYQHLYIFAIYSLVTIFQVYFLEFVSFAQDLVGFRRREAKLKPLVWMLANKLLVLGYSLLLPLAVLANSPWEVVSGWFLGHLLCGITLGVFFQTTHLHEATLFLDSDTRGVIEGSSAMHVLRTTSEVAPDNRLLTWLSGGLNLHVTHHLFPNISQVHLPALSKIVRATAKEFGAPYYQYSFFGGLASHLRLMKVLGGR